MTKAALAEAPAPVEREAPAHSAAPTPPPGADSTQARAGLRATVVLGSSSVVSVAVGLASSKLWAMLVGPTGVGTLALLQSVSGLGALLVGAGVGTGLVRLGAAGGADARRLRALRDAAWLLVGCGIGVAAVLLLGFAGPIGRLMLGRGPDAPLWETRVLVLAVAATLATGVHVGLINALHRVDALARIAVATSVASAAAGLAVIAVWRLDGVPAAVVASAAAGWLVARRYTPRELAAPGAAATRAERAAAVRDLLAFGAPFTASQLVGAGVQLLLPAVVLHELGREGVGVFRAASAISTAYLTLVASAFAKDYYPRVAAARQDRARLRELVDQQHRLVLLLTGPLCVTFVALAPLMVQLVYSRAFLGAVDVLRWQVVGELFRFSSFAFAHVILARSRPSVYFACELVGGAALLGFSALGVRWLGLPGLGAAYLASYVVYAGLTHALLRRDLGGALSRRTALAFLGAVAATAFVSALPWLAAPAARIPLAALVSVAVVAGSAWGLWGDVRRARGPRPEQRPAGPPRWARAR